MKVSVVTVCFNSAATISNCVDSINSQENVEIEHIVIDGGSCDETIELLAPFRSHIAHIISEPDEGIYDAMNKGLSLATGDFVGFLNSDDHFRSKASLAVLVHALQQAQSDVVFADIEQTDAVGRVLRVLRGAGFRYKNLSRGRFPPHPTFYARRQMLLELGGFNTSYEIAGDFDLMIRVFRRSEVRWTYVPERIVSMRVGGASHQGVFRYLKNSREIARACRANGLKPSYLFIYGRIFRKAFEIIAGLSERIRV